MWDGISSQLMGQSVRPAMLILEETYIRKVDPNPVLLLLVTSVMSNSVWPRRRQATRLLYPWDCSGKNTRMGCHFLLQCMKVKSESEVARSCPTLSDPMDWGPPGSYVHGIFQAWVLEWGAIAFSREPVTIFISKMLPPIKKKKSPY